MIIDNNINTKLQDCAVVMMFFNVLIAENILFLLRLERFN